MTSIDVDFTKTTGPMKALHGINNSPVVYNAELPELREAGIPYARMHDAGGTYGGTYLVDIPNVFPNFDADPKNPASYDFAFTDAYFKTLTSAGMQIFYRLGVTIENNWRVKPSRIHPPADFAKWARICEGIIRHYNEAWANGFKYNIEYWEIWNEPENPPMWTGTREQYYELYRVAANYLKPLFPNIKIGGYSGCGFYAINRENMSDFYKGFVPYFTDFLKFVTTPETAAPLDFYSWHLYTTDLEEIMLHADFVDKNLREHGLDKTESIFNEWNYVDWCDPYRWEGMKDMPGATFMAAAFCKMQNSPIDKAMYYSALPTHRYCGLYTFPGNEVTKTYFSFKAFNELYKLGQAVSCSSDETKGIYSLAAKDASGKGAILIVNRSIAGQKAALKLTGAKSQPVALLLDKRNSLAPAEIVQENAITMPPLSVALLQT